MYLIFSKDYKHRIEVMTQEYDRRFNEIDEKNRKLKINMDEIKIQREFLIAEKNYMQMRIQEIQKGTEVEIKRKKRSLMSMLSSGSGKEMKRKRSKIN